MFRINSLYIHDIFIWCVSRSIAITVMTYLQTHPNIVGAYFIGGVLMDAFFAFAIISTAELLDQNKCIYFHVPIATTIWFILRVLVLGFDKLIFNQVDLMVTYFILILDMIICWVAYVVYIYQASEEELCGTLS